MARQAKSKGSTKTSATIVQHWQTRFKANLAKRFFLRLHMSLILFTTGLAGFLVNRIMLWAGVHSMPVRYGVSVLCGYGVFLLCIRLWLRYVGGTPSRRPLLADRPGDVYVGDIGQGVVDGLHGAGRSLGSWSPGSSGGPVAPSGDAAAGTFFGSGSPSGAVGDAAEGTFLGGGPSASGVGEAAGGAFWGGDGDAPAPGDAEINAAAAAFFDHSAVADATTSGGSLGDVSLPSGGGGGGLDLDLGDDAGAVVAIIALVVIVLAVCGAGVYLVWQAPMILSDAAFQVVMTWAVRRKAGEVDDAAWVGSVVKATVWPFVAMLVLTVVTGAVVQGMYPGVHSLGQLLNG
jgi:hypothetical protein